MIPRHDEPPRRGRLYRRRPGVDAVLPLAGRGLVTAQARADPPDATGCGEELQLPGGGIDPGEQVLAALHREVLEETGWRIAAPRRLGAFRRFVFMPEYDLWAEKLCHVYLARPVRPLHPPREAGHRALWLSAAEARACVAGGGARHFLALARL